MKKTALKEKKTAEMTANYTYMVQCADGTYYTGWTTDITKRVAAHNSGSGAKYTRARLPVALVYAEVHPTKVEAMQREAAIKKLTRKEKEALVASFSQSPLSLRPVCPDSKNQKKS